MKNKESHNMRKHASREYKREINKQYWLFHNKFISKIRNLKNTDPKTYWKIINGSKTEKSDITSHISADVFQEHFKNLAGEPETNMEDSNVEQYTDHPELDAPITDTEVQKAMKKLKANKACGYDQITNEFLKASSLKLLSLFTKVFNIILCSGKTPDEWSIGIIKPIYKKKGPDDDPSNYRGITILSCFGKLFSAVLNNRLVDFLDKHKTIGFEQAGFRAGHSTVDHIFTLHSMINILLSKGKRLPCLFIDYEKAFDRVNRAFLWQKVLNSGVNGKVLRVIKDMYMKAKSCVEVGDKCSDFFSCLTGVRQGENLSPLLFAIFLNDLQAYIESRMTGLSSIRAEAQKLGWDNESEQLLLKMFVLLYADDTVICAETVKDLQQGIDAMADYCTEWELKINIAKTKIIVFSKGKIRRIPNFKYKNQEIEVVFGFQYLGIHFNYNNKFNVAQKYLYDKASRAMFSLLKKCKKLMLPLDVRLDLFEKMIVPILLYGCEVWCPTMTELASKLQLRFFKIIFKLRKSTTSNMIYGELGKFPIEITAKSRMLSYWFKLVHNKNSDKLSSIIYKLMYNMYVTDSYTSSFLLSVETTLNQIGLSGMWQNQFNLTHSAEWFKSKVTRCLQDQFIHSWYTNIDTNETFYNYRLYKNNFGFEKYLITLPTCAAIKLIRFRTQNHKLPIQKGRFENIPRNERKCTKCTDNDLGDELHYIFKC